MSVEIHRYPSEVGFSFKKLGGSVLSKAKEAGQFAVKTALTPLQIQVWIFKRFALPLARALCRAPKPILDLGAKEAGVSPEHLGYFCMAVRAKNMRDIRKFLPVAMAVAIKLGAKGVFPPIEPVLKGLALVPAPLKRKLFGKQVASMLGADANYWRHERC